MLLPGLHKFDYAVQNRRMNFKQKLNWFSDDLTLTY